MAGWTKTYTLDFTSSGDTVYSGVDKLEDNIDAIITIVNLLKKSFSSASAPTSPAPDEGQLWWDSTNDTLKVYAGSAWTSVTAAADEKVKADTLDGTADYLDGKVQKSIAVDTSTHKLELDGDEAAPGNFYHYATDGAGSKEWSLAHKVLADSGDTNPAFLDGKVDDSSIEVNASDKIALKDAGIAAGKVADWTSGEYAEVNSPVEESTTSASYTKLKEILCTRGGDVKVKWQMKTDDAGATAYGRVYKDGVAEGTEKTTTSTSWTNQEDTITGLAKDDLLQLYCYNGGVAAELTLVKHFRICCGNPLLGGGN